MTAVKRNDGLYLSFLVVVTFVFVCSCRQKDSATFVTSQFDISKPMYIEYVIDKKRNDTLYKLKIGLDNIQDIDFELNNTIQIQALVTRAYINSPQGEINKIILSFKEGKSSNFYDTLYNSNQSISIRKGFHNNSSLAGMTGEFLLLLDSTNNFLDNTLKERKRLEELFYFIKNKSGRKEIEFVSIEITKSKFSIYSISD